MRMKKAKKILFCKFRTWWCYMRQHPERACFFADNTFWSQISWNLNFCIKNEPPPISGEGPLGLAGRYSLCTVVPALSATCGFV